MTTAVQNWVGMTREELDEIYQRALPGQVPSGDMRGTAILINGPMFARAFARFARLFAWQGKVFFLCPPDRETGALVNKISPFGLTFIVAMVYRDKSWMDGKETIVLDYSNTSFFAQKIRDEIREVEPGVYLGKVWWGRTRILDFALSAKPKAR